MKFKETEEYDLLIPYIDLDLLNEIFRTTMHKYGVAEVPTIDPGEFELFDWIAPLSYLVDTDEVFVNPDKLIDILEGLHVPVAATVLSHILLHEQTHRVSKGELQTRTIQEGQKTIHVTERISGYSRSEIRESGDESEGQKWFEIFNEGVTETIARAMFDQYTQAFGVPREVVEELHRLTGRDANSEHNNRFNVEVADTVAETLALDAGVSKQEMWRAIVMGALRGDKLDEPETREWLNSSVDSHDFVERLRDLEMYQDEVNKIVKEMREAQKRKRALR